MARSTAVNVLLKGAQATVGFGSFALLSFWLSPADFGAFAMATTVTGLLGLLGDAGIVAGLVRTRNPDAELEATGFWLAAGGGVLLFLAALVAAPFLARFYRSPSVGLLAAVAAFNFLFLAPGRVSTAALVRDLRFGELGAINLASSVAGLVVGVTLSSFGFGAWSLVAMMLVATLGQGLLPLWRAPRPCSPRRFSRSHAKSLGRFGSEITGFGLLLTLGRSLDNILAGRFLGAGATGLMAMSYRFTLLPVQRAMGALSDVFLPTLTQLPAEEHAPALGGALRLAGCLLAPVSLGVVAFAPELVSALPARWIDLVPLLRIAATGTLLEPLGFLCVAALTARGRSRSLFLISLWLLPFSWGGALGATLSGKTIVFLIAWAVVNLAGALMLFIATWRELGLASSFVPNILQPLLIAAGSTALARALVSVAGSGGSLRGLALGVVATVLAQLLLVRWLMPAELARLLRFTRYAARPL